MSIITRQGKGSKLTIEEMDNNLIYLQSLSGGNFSEAKIGSEIDYSKFDQDGSLRFFGAATTYDDQTVDILSELSPLINPLTAKIFRNSDIVNSNYGIYTSGLTYGTFPVSGYTSLNNALNNNLYTISFWFKYLNRQTYTSTVFSIPDIIECVAKYNRCTVNLSGNTFDSTTDTKIGNGNWHHFCYVQDNNNGTIYINNIPTNIIISTTLTSLTSLPEIGYYGTGTTSDGVVGLSNLRFYNIALDINQVTELYSYGSGLDINLHPLNINENDVVFNFKNLESSGLTLYNSALNGVGQDITFLSQPYFISGINSSIGGVILPAFELPPIGTLGDQRSVRFEMSHSWKTGTPISLHMHVSTNIPVLSGQSIIFRLEETIQDIYGVLSSNSINVINPTKIFEPTSAKTYTFTTNQDIPAHSNFILEFDIIDMSNYTSVSTTGVITITRLYGTFPGDIFEVQAIRMHYEIDSTGSRQRWAK